MVALDAPRIQEARSQITDFEKHSTHGSVSRPSEALAEWTGAPDGVVLEFGTAAESSDDA
jgi:hypothetical protein